MTRARGVTDGNPCRLDRETMNPKTALACVEVLARLNWELPVRDRKTADRAIG